MRELFWSERLLERSESGEWRKTKVRESPISLIYSGKHCVASQVWLWIDGNDEERVRVHQYLTADGQIGASGKPDPKRIFLNNTIYRLTRPSQQEPCQVCGRIGHDWPKPPGVSPDPPA
jgi:hypothetical protein